MPVTINGTTGITNGGGYTGDGVVFADTTPANTLVTTTGGNVGAGTDSPTEKLQVVGSIRVTSNANNFNVLGGQFDFASNNTRISAYNSAGSSVSIYTNSAGGNVSEKAVVDANTFYIGVAFSGKRNFDFALNGDAQKKGAFNQPDTAQPYGYIDYYYGATRSGYILWNSTSLSLTNLSDYRLKDNVQPMTGALAKVVALNPVTYTWKSNGEAGRGFIAHELQEVAPECVRGDKDAVDEDGNPSYQGIDTTILISTLVAAIKEQQVIIEQLRLDVAALKGAQA